MFNTTPKSRRIKLLMNNEIPTQNEIIYFLGPNLAKFLCEYSHPNIKKLLGITPPLQGVDKDLWNSPSDQLIDKECLKPPLKQKYIKACTHKGILELGEQAMERWKLKTATKLRDDLRRNEKDTRLMFEAEKRQSINFAISHVKYLYDIHMRNLVEEHESKLESLVAKVIRKSNEKLQNVVLRERMKIKRDMMKKLEMEIGYVVIHMCEEFDREFQAQKNIMITELNEILRREREIANSELKDFHERRSEDLQRVEAELKNEFNSRITDISRAKQADIKAEENVKLQYLRKKIETLEDLLIEAKYVVEMFADEKSKLDNPSWRIKLCELIHQFQKFINIISLKAIPGQIEIIRFLEALVCGNMDKNSDADKNEKRENVEKKKFVENLEKLKMRSEKFRVNEIIDKNGKKWQPIQLIPEEPQLYCTEEQLVSPIVKSDTNICLDDNYLDKDSSKSMTRSTLASDESLPFVYFKNKLYVRSDYRPDSKDESSAKIKTIEELVDGNCRFVLGLNDSEPHNIIIDDIKDDPCSSTNHNKHKRDSDNHKMRQDEFQTRAQDLIKAIEQVEEELMETNEKFTESNDGRVVRDLINHLKTMKNGEKKIAVKNSTPFRTNKNSTIEESSNQFAISRVKSIIRIFRLDPSLQSILIRSAK